MTLFPVLFTAVLLMIYVALLLFYRASWLNVTGFIPPAEQAQGPLISVIIPARNEEQNIPNLLASLRRQSYPAELFEVLIVDDHSSDNTAAVVREHSHAKLIQLADFVNDGLINSYKKKAIEIGIKHATGTLIVTTDADCTVPANWLSTIAAFYTIELPQLIVMPVAINCGKRGIEIFQALDFMALQGITGAAVNKGVHSMCNGANLAYTREAFYAVNGFAGIDKVASGDDMLLMHKIAQHFPKGIRYLKSEQVIVQTEPVHTVKQFFNQRIRWASKADQYQDKSIFWVLLLVYLLNVLLLVLPILACLLSGGFLWKGWILLLLLKTAAEIHFLFPVAQFFKKESLLILFPLAQPFHILYTIIAGWLGKFSTYNWKGRTVK